MDMNTADVPIGVSTEKEGEMFETALSLGSLSARMDDDLARTLHKDILRNVKDAKYDTFSKYISEDPFVATCIKLQSKSLNVAHRAPLGKLQPQETRVKTHEHYLHKTAAYWRNWKRDNDLLEYISAHSERPTAKISRPKRLRSLVHRDSKATTFSGASSAIKRSSKVDLIGPTNVPFLMQQTAQGVPQILRLPFKDSGDISSFAAKPGVGLLSSTAPSRPKIIPSISNSEPVFDADS